MSGVWAAMLLAAVFWSVRSDPPTVPEQRDIARALAGLRTASGAVVAAAQDERWVLSLGELRLEDCSINPAWDGLVATREVVLYVPEGDAWTALGGIADGLPANYAAGMNASRGATRLSLFADAGEHVGIEAEAHSSDQVLTVRVFTGCRPDVPGLDPADPAAGSMPDLLRSTVAGVTGSGGGAVEAIASRAVVCPDGGTLAAFVADAGPATPDSGPRGVPEGALPVWTDASGWAYRMGSESVVITTDRDRFRVTVTTACRPT
ncbi:hypothetical protein [Actinoplanes italicus]|uniref:hypothetical protein n=1 Tax=Actinoplanes italicus TaxID=113567 RepID=UPI001EF1FAED|nr:hypothetical protein [Actinoplanes italicus]